MLKIVGQAVNDYGMIEDGDHITVGLSGGADSIALIMLLSARLKYLPIKYHLHPVLVDHDNGKNPERMRQIDDLIAIIRERTGLDSDIIRLPIVEYLHDNPKNVCFKCAQIRRSELIKYSDAKGYRLIALGHHKDDVVETVLMNLFYKREVSAMMPRLSLFEGKFELIRPLIYLEKRQIVRYITDIGIDPIPEYCPAKFIKKDLRRDTVREIVKTLSRQIPGVKDNIFASLRNVHSDYLLSTHYRSRYSGRNKRP